MRADLILLQVGDWRVGPIETEILATEARLARAEAQLQFPLPHYLICKVVQNP